jgi:hypothetical protein
VLADVEQTVGKLILLGADGVIEAGRVVYTIQDADSFIEFKTNQREFLINFSLPVVGTLDDTLPVYIEFGDTVYGVYSYMTGSSNPITIGDLKSNMVYSQEAGYLFTTKMIFLKTSDYEGFAISPVSITADQLANIIEDTSTVVVSVDNNGTKLNIQLSAEIVNKLAKVLVTPVSTPSATELVGVDSNNMQTMLGLGSGLYILDGNLHASAGGGTSNYEELNNLPIANTTNTTSLTPQANETIEGTINLHKVSKTGALADAIQDSTHRTVTDTEKTNWNNKSNFDGQFSSLSNIPNASTGVAGIIQLATDQEAETGTEQNKAVNPKQLKTAIDGLGSVFTLKGSVANVSALPSTGNNIGDVWYVISESVGYIWLNDGTTNKWEQLGLPIDLSTYVQFSDIVNTLASTASDKPLSALQGKNLNDMITSLTGELGTTQQNVAGAQANISALQTADGQNVKTTGNQDISGTKNFNGTFQVNGGTISYSNGTFFI